MKRIVLTLISITLVALAFGQRLASTAKPVINIGNENAVFSWTAKEFDFGKIKVGTPVTHEFIFTNSGKAPLVISTVQASCGCTVTAYSKEPIVPAGKGFVKATYNAANIGQFTKTVTVNANTEDGVVQLTIKGEVVQ